MRTQCKQHALDDVAVLDACVDLGLMDGLFQVSFCFAFHVLFE